jgi:hypothetical protein
VVGVAVPGPSYLAVAGGERVLSYRVWVEHVVFLDNGSASPGVLSHAAVYPIFGKRNSVSHVRLQL